MSLRFICTRQSEIVCVAYELNPEDAKSLIHSMNKTRGNYYQHNTGLNWSEAVHYDICLNTAGLKKEKIIDIIKNYIKTKID